MQKKFIAITAVAIFFLAQFGKVINFCVCSLEVYQQTSGFTCDCEKQLFSSIKTDRHDKNQTPQHFSAQQSTEELFTFTHFSSFNTIIAVFFATWPLNGAEALQHTDAGSVFHPPLLFA